jgi:hypothetical protein
LNKRKRYAGCQDFQHFILGRVCVYIRHEHVIFALQFGFTLTVMSFERGPLSPEAWLPAPGVAVDILTANE